ncbi:MAG: LemA family protein [Anaerovibrio sp.]|uniref:LemA family protein n=1 Tax=Anaerovibrio sp. TaxID=1872532 RepID=UPI0025D7265F|nr:LemA family protein [Anaerovibrio sp.]MCR5175655.1 LemA family protein [Anaerovibrio sp.]
MSKGSIIAIVIAVVVIFAGIGTYNEIKSARIDVDAQYGQIENQIQRRADLIPNLVSTVKGYMQYEEKVLTEVTEARSQIAGAKSPEEMAQADAALTGALGRLIAVAENYPALKSDAHFTELMREISGSENRIAVARRDYNDAIKRYNVIVSTFPGNMFAGIMGYSSLPQFEAEEAAHTVPKVAF